MKKKSLLYASFGALIFLFSCQKDISGPASQEVMNTPLPGQTVYCRIESIWENPNQFDQRFILILYDQYENPTAITTPLPGTGHPYRVFKYDSWHRLRELIGDYGNGHFEFWHFYGFDLSGRIGVDTVYTFGQLLDKPVGYIEKRISNIEYDSQNRIVKVSNTNNFGASWVDTYAYDGTGNLVGGTYDHRINLSRTNDIWMFLGRDYSLNNRFNADAYNTNGYPTLINLSGAFDTWLPGEVDLTHSQISYGCRPSYY